MAAARLRLSKCDFVNPDVLDAVNPHPVWGYAHGPIPNNNPDWDFKRPRGRYVSEKEQILALASEGSPAPMVTMNSYNTVVCDILIQGNRMCGAGFQNGRNFSAHIRIFHSGAANPLGFRSIDEKTAGDNAIKRWVLMGGWRNALYANEPNQKNIHNSMIGYYCDALEEIARTDVQFAVEYGTQFHRASRRSGYVRGILLPPNQPMPLVAPSTPGSDHSLKSSRCEQSTQIEPTSDNDPDVNPDFTSGSGPDCENVSQSVSEIDSEPEDQEEWPIDAVTDIFAGQYLPSSNLDAAYGPISEGMDRVCMRKEDCSQSD